MTMPVTEPDVEYSASIPSPKSVTISGSSTMASRSSIRSGTRSTDLRSTAGRPGADSVDRVLLFDRPASPRSVGDQRPPHPRSRAQAPCSSSPLAPSAFWPRAVVVRTRSRLSARQHSAYAAGKTATAARRSCSAPPRPLAWTGPAYPRPSRFLSSALCGRG